MAVANEKIIQKMINELQQALLVGANPQAMERHVSSVKLLCELIMEDDTTEKNNTEISADEMKAMIGESQAKEKEIQSKGINDDDDDVNGTSIFDF